MDRLGHGNKISVAAQDQRSSAGGGHADGTQRVINTLGSIAAPAEQSREEPAQGNGQRTLRDQRDAADADLQAGLENDLAAPCTINAQAVLAISVAEDPLVPLSDQARMQSRYLMQRIIESDLATRRGADRDRASDRTA